MKSEKTERPMATKTLLIIEEFLRLPEPPNARYELVERELVTMSPGMLRKLGLVVAEQAFQLSETTVRIPDVAFVRAGRPPAGVFGEGFEPFRAGEGKAAELKNNSAL